MKNYVSIQIISLIAYSLIDKLWLVRSKAAAVTYCNLSNTTAVFFQPHGNSLAWGRSLDISISVKNCDLSLLDNISGNLCIKIKGIHTYKKCYPFIFPSSSAWQNEKDAYIPITLQVPYNKETTPLNTKLQISGAIQFYKYGNFTINIKPVNFQLLANIHEQEVLRNALVINLERKPGRFFYTNERLKQQNFVNIHQMLATDGNSVNVSTFEKMQIYHGSPGHRAASASHIRAWEYVYKRFQEDATLNIYTIFEDDILFHEDFADQLHRYVEEIPSNADIIFMGWMRGAIWTTEYNEKTGKLQKVQYADADTSEDEGFVIKRHPACLHAYIVTRLGINKLLENILPLNDAIDLKVASMIFESTLKGYAFNGKKMRKTSIENAREHRDRGIVYQDDALGTDIDGFNTVMLLEENRKLRKKIQFLQNTVDELKRHQNVCT
jgi:GR25 family glycosyltransferase involved in LPS biosynthesis